MGGREAGQGVWGGEDAIRAPRVFGLWKEDMDRAYRRDSQVPGRDV